MSKLINSSVSIANECIKLINEQNADSYKIIKVPKLEIIKFNPSTNLLFTKQLLDFYQSFMPLVKFAHDIYYAIQSMDYSSEELSIHINRSPKFILDLEHKLAKRTAQLQRYTNQLKTNIDLIIKEYCDHIHTNINDKIVINDTSIELIYQCMEYDFKFIPYGTAIMVELFNSNLISDKHKVTISNLSNALKHKYLDVSKDSNELSNNNNCLLQTFNLVPTINNLTLAQVINHLFATTVRDVSINNIESILKSISKKISNEIAFIVIFKHNNDHYFDLTNLFDNNKISQITNSNGVSIKYIDTFDTLKSRTISNKHKNSIEGIITAYNYDKNDKNREIYILWTNDNQEFKLRDQPLSMRIADKILSNQSSDIIDAYNNQFEEKLTNMIKDHSVVSYKQVKYLSFDTDNEETIFINLLCDKVIKYITSIKNIDSVSDMSYKILNIIQCEFNKFKPFHKKGSIPIHAHLVFTNIAIELSNKLEKDLINWAMSGQIIDNIESIVHRIIATNDNIYTRFIASYYMSITS